MFQLFSLGGSVGEERSSKAKVEDNFLSFSEIYKKPAPILLEDNVEKADEVIPLGQSVLEDENHETLYQELYEKISAEKTQEFTEALEQERVRLEAEYAQRLEQETAKIKEELSQEMVHFIQKGLGEIEAVLDKRIAEVLSDFWFAYLSEEQVQAFAKSIAHATLESAGPFVITGPVALIDILKKSPDFDQKKFNIIENEEAELKLCAGDTVLSTQLKPVLDELKSLCHEKPATR